MQLEPLKQQNASVLKETFTDVGENEWIFTSNYLRIDFQKKFPVFLPSITKSESPHLREKLFSLKKSNRNYL